MKLKTSASLVAWSSFLLLAAYSDSAASAESRADTLEYSVLMAERTAGSEIDKFLPDGSIESAYEYNDRGRGPKVTIRYRRAPDGALLATDIAGNDYLKSRVDEHFAVKGDRAGWQSLTEYGEAAAGPFYISSNGSNVEIAMLAALAIKRNGTVPLFPAGTARVEKLTEMTVADHGDRIHVTSYAVSGLDFEPHLVWLDDDLRLFAIPDAWFAIVRRGWEHANQELYQADRKAKQARAAALASKLAEHPTHPVAIKDVRVFDSVNAKRLDGQTVIIEGDRITQVGPSGSVSVPAGAEVIDGSAKTLLPGLFDMHVHVQSEAEGMLHIASGVTSVRDMGNDIETLRSYETSWDAGTTIGPRISKAGLIDGKGPMQAPTGFFVTNEAEAIAAVNRYADLGYVQIKIYSSLDPKLVPVIAKAAHERGLRVSGHVPNGMTAADFVVAGADEIQHVNFIFLNFLKDKVKDTRTPERFVAVAQYAAGLDVMSPAVDDFLKLLRSRKTTVDITLATFEDMFVARPGLAGPSLSPVLDRLPAQVRRSAYAGGLPAQGDRDKLYKKSYQAMLTMAARLYYAGVPLVAGTDWIPGFTLHRELELWVRADIPAKNALQVATYNAAKLLHRDKDLGSIEPGKLADFVLVDGDPTLNISDIRRCRLVGKNGILYRSDDVYAAVGVKPATH